MAKILKKEALADRVFRYRLDAPRIARKQRPGQFILLRPVRNSERIPLTIVDADVKGGWIDSIFQVVGRTTVLLSMLNEGDSILDLAGPFGQPTHIKKFGTCLCIGGGMGIASLYPITRGLREEGNSVTSIIGARTKSLLILRGEFESASDELHVTTDDGTSGQRGIASNVFKELCDKGDTFDVAFVIGPVMMMKATSRLTIAAGIKTYVSLKPIMVDAVGMCGGCRVTVGGHGRLACIDGPEFDAAEVDWNDAAGGLLSRGELETASLERHPCELENFR